MVFLSSVPRIFYTGSVQFIQGMYDLICNGLTRFCTDRWHDDPYGSSRSGSGSGISWACTPPPGLECVSYFEITFRCSHSLATETRERYQNICEITKNVLRRKDYFPFTNRDEKGSGWKTSTISALQRSCISRLLQRCPTQWMPDVEWTGLTTVLRSVVSHIGR